MSRKSQKVKRDSHINDASPFIQCFNYRCPSLCIVYITAREFGGGRNVPSNCFKKSEEQWQTGRIGVQDNPFQNIHIVLLVFCTCLQHIRCFPDECCSHITSQHFIAAAAAALYIVSATDTLAITRVAATFSLRRDSLLVKCDEYIEEILDN